MPQENPHGAAGADARDPVTPVRDAAFFVNPDGTLLEWATTPHGVLVDSPLRELMRRLIRLTDGAVALLSGRSIMALDALMEPLVLPSAGLHGFERRNAVGHFFRRPLPPGNALERARLLMRQAAQKNPHLYFEDKRFALALHYRRAPDLESHVTREVTRIVRLVGAGLQMRRGRLVVELYPRGASIETAMAEFMREAPFRGRRPILLGDDLADEGAFAWVNAAGGLSVGVDVQPGSAARSRFASVDATRCWLDAMLC